ncbi:hypothetical protein RFI_25253, partial [Reticulomyxa filosa]
IFFFLNKTAPFFFFFFLATHHQKAVIRLREFLLRQFNDLGVPRTNINLKQQYLLNFKAYVYVLQYYFMTFIAAHAPEVGKEVCTFYCDLMSKVYIGHFRRYVQSLSRHKEPQVPEKSDLIGTEVDRTGSIFSSKKTREYLNHVFNLANRVHILKEFKETPLVMQMIKTIDRFHYE